MKSFVHNCIAHPLWWLTEALADAARLLHDLTAPPEPPGGKEADPVGLSESEERDG